MVDPGGTAETATQTLHRLTAFRPGVEWGVPVDDPRVLRDLEVNDTARLPWFFKRYEDSLPVVALPRELPRTGTPAVHVLAGTAPVESRSLDLAQLSRLLHLSAGVVRTAKRPYATWLFRASGSAGGRFPLEVYVAVPEGHDLPAGVHWYHPLDHALVQVGPPPKSGSPALVVTGVPWRTGWRYRERGYRHVYWDAGTMLAQVLAVADSAGVIARLYTRFPDPVVSALVGADRVHEFPVAVVALGGGSPAVVAGGPAAMGAVDADPVEFPLITAAQAAGERDDLGPPWGRGAPVDVPLGASPPIDDVVLARGSQRRMDPDGSLPAAFLRTSLAAAMRGIDVSHRVVVHAVDGVEPGLYRWPDLASPVLAGPLRDELYGVCMDQSLGSDAAFVVYGAADIGALDDSEYREVHLAAGMVEGRLHLLAYALGAGATGMTFHESETGPSLREPLDALLFTCVGVPEYASKPGGLPGSPTAVSLVTPRIGS